MRVIECDLAIIGGGIAGPALAAALADCGYRIVLVERNAGPLDTARGDHLQPATCEWLERWGVLDSMFKRGAERRCGARWQTRDGELVLDVRVDDLDIPHPYFLYLNHELISEVLLDRASTNENFTLIRPGTARIARNADSPGRHGLFVNHADKENRISAHCVAIADGRASLGRKALGIGARIHNYENPLLVLFTPRTFDDARNDVHVFFTPVGVISVVPRTGGEWKIGFPLARDKISDWTSTTSEGLGRHLAELVPVLDGIKPHVAGVYPVAMVNAERWVDGNCVLLGDACHALHPGRSQGMNIALLSVALLAVQLADHGFAGAENSINDLLHEFESIYKAPIDARLEANHARGLEMDQPNAATIENMRRALAEVAASPAQTHSYCMRAAGY